MNELASAIDVRNLSIDYRARGTRRVQAVRHLSLRVSPGEVVGLVGPNGAGKTSTIKVLMGLMRPSEGEAHVRGYAAGSVEARARTGYLPEVAVYYPFLSARETLRLYASLQGIPRRQIPVVVDSLLVKVGLEQSGDRRLRTFSKGMLQRVGVAQAIMGDPEVLILDEVTAGLDPIARHDVREILLEFKSRGAAVFFSSHELSEVTLLCDRVIMMRHGEIIEERRLDEMLSSIRRYVVVVKGAWEPPELPGGVHRRAFANGNAVLVADSEMSCGALIQSILADGKHVEQSFQEPGSLEDYFVEKVGHEIT